VAEISGEVVGYASYSRRYDPHARERTLWLSDLAVAARHRGLGVGRALIEAVAARAAELEAASVSFEVWRENASALRFYDRVGAEHLGDRLLMRFTVGPRAQSRA
jgi:ribosomal protein S18 acetylase RimI-like enzyme